MAVDARDERIAALEAKVPELSEADLSEYLRVLAHAGQDWRRGEAHRLLIVFPATAEPRIRAVLERGSAQSA